VLDARERLLSPAARVVPQHATAIFSLLESVDVAEENWHEVGDGYAIVSQSCNTGTGRSCGDYFVDEDHLPPSPYTCLFVGHQLPSGHRLLSSEVEALGVDFENVAQLKLFHSDQFRSQVVLEAVEDGVVSALVSVGGVVNLIFKTDINKLLIMSQVQWFRLGVFDGVELCTAPKEETCWQQSVFPLYPPITVAKGDRLKFELLVRDEKLFIRNLNPPPPNNDGRPRQLLRAPPDFDLLGINDRQILDFYLNSIVGALERAERGRRKGGLASLLDCTDLLVAERLRDPEMEWPGQNRVDWEVASSRAVVRYVNHEASNMRSAPTALAKGCCDAILHWPFNQRGLLMDDYLASILEVRLRVPNALLIPSSITLTACLIRLVVDWVERKWSDISKN